MQYKEVPETNCKASRESCEFKVHVSTSSDHFAQVIYECDHTYLYFCAWLTFTVLHKKCDVVEQRLQWVQEEHREMLLRG